MTYLGQVYAIIWKDLLIEVRTRERVASMGAFAVLSGVLFNFAMDWTAVRPQDVGAGLIWMTIVFGGMLGLGRTFMLEASDSAFVGVLMSPAPKDAIFLGKAIANFIFLMLIAVFIVVVFSAFFGLDLGPNPGLVFVVLALGALGFVALGTLFSALASGTGMGETLLPILVFPLLVPMIVFGVSATSRLLAGRPVSEVAGNVRLLGAFAVGAVAAGAALFRFVVEE